MAVGVVLGRQSPIRLPHARGVGAGFESEQAVGRAFLFEPAEHAGRARAAVVPRATPAVKKLARREQLRRLLALARPQHVKADLSVGEAEYGLEPRSQLPAQRRAHERFV